MKHDMTKVMLYIVPAVAISLAATQALAEGTTSDRSAPPSSAASLATRSADAGKRATSIGQPMRSLDKDMRVSQLIGMEVVGRDGNKIGEVEDLVIDTQNGNVVHAILQSDRLLDVDRKMAIPLDRTHGGMRDGKFVLDAASGEMAEFRRFSSDAWPDWNRSTADKAAMRYRRASDLLDADLKDRSGNDVGDVEDIIVNVGSGKVRYGVAEFDPSWFQAGRLVVVPLRDVRAEDRDGTDLVITADREALRDAPSFDRNSWPDLNDNTFRRDLDRYASSGGGQG
jgi:sporulation protein YlmC with PRC-barrel domain